MTSNRVTSDNAPSRDVLDQSLAELDPEIAAVLDGELARQRGTDRKSVV